MRSFFTVCAFVVVGMLLGGCPDKEAAKAFNSCTWGRKHHQELEHALALQEYESALQVKPHYAGVFMLRGLVYQDKYDFEKALADMTEAIRLSPKFALAY